MTIDLSSILAGEPEKSGPASTTINLSAILEEEETTAPAPDQGYIAQSINEVVRRVTGGGKAVADAILPPPGAPERGIIGRGWDALKGVGEIVGAPLAPVGVAGSKVGEYLAQDEMKDDVLRDKLAKARDLKARLGTAAGADPEVNAIPHYEELLSLPYEERVARAGAGAGAAAEFGAGMLLPGAGIVPRIRDIGRGARAAGGVRAAAAPLRKPAEPLDSVLATPRAVSPNRPVQPVVAAGRTPKAQPVPPIEGPTITQAGVESIPVEAIEAQVPGLSARWEHLVDRTARSVSEAIKESPLGPAYRYLLPGRGAPLEFREAKALMEAQIANGVDEAVSLGTALKRDLTPAEQVRAWQVLRGGITSDPKLQAVTQPVRDSLNAVQRELIDTGRLSPEVVARFEQRFGPYFRRMYDEHLIKDTPPVVKGSIPARMGQTFERGDRITVKLTKEELHSPTLRLKDPEIDRLLRDGYKMESVDYTKRTATYFRDVTEAERKALGEIREGAFPAATAIAEGRRDAALARFFESITANKEWINPAEAPGFTQMPKDPRMGALSGRWVRSDIAAEVNDALAIRKDWDRLLGTITNSWKIGKVLNPATMMRNIMSSTMMADWGGLSPWKPSGGRAYAKAIAGMAGKNDDAARLLEEARQGGLFGSTFNRQEINALYDGFLASKSETAMGRLVDGINAVREKFRDVGDTVAGAAKRVTGEGMLGQAAEKVAHPTQLYGTIDQFFKSALYLHAREGLGLSPKLALRYAKKYGIDYQDISPAARTLRRLPMGAPFITFASKAVPLAIETAVKHPIRFFKWPAIALGVNEVSRETLGVSPLSVESARRLGDMMNPVRYVLLPTTGDKGEQQYLDLGYIFPYNDLLQAYDWAMGYDGNYSFSFEPGGAVVPLWEVFGNHSLFTGKPIWKDTDTYAEQAAKISDYLGKAFLPSLFPPVPGTGFRGGYGTEGLRRALAPEVQLPGESPLSGMDLSLRKPMDPTKTVLSKVGGISIKEVNPSVARGYRMLEIRGKIQDLSREIAALHRKGLTPKQIQVEQSRLTDKIMRLKKEADALQ